MGKRLIKAPKLLFTDSGVLYYLLGIGTRNRDHHGTEVDLVIEDAASVTLIECKSGATVGADFFSSLDKVAAIVEASGVRKVQRLVIYGGDAAQSRSSGRVVPWHKAAGIGN